MSEENAQGLAERLFTTEEEVVELRQAGSASLLSSFDEMMQTPGGLERIVSLCTPYHQRRANVYGVARRVLRQFEKQYFFQGTQGRISLPSFKIMSTQPVDGFVTVENGKTFYRYDLLARAMNLARAEVISAETDYLVRLVAAAARYAEQNPADGGVPRTISSTDLLLVEAVKDLTEAGKEVITILINPRDYRSVRERQAEYGSDLTFETRRELLMPGLLAYYKGASVIQTRQVAQGALHVFAKPTDSTENPELPRFDRILSIHEPLTLSCREEEGGPVIYAEEVIGIGLSNHYCQLITIAPAEEVSGS